MPQDATSRVLLALDGGGAGAIADLPEETTVVGLVDPPTFADLQVGRVKPQVGERDAFHTQLTQACYVLIEVGSDPGHRHL